MPHNIPEIINLLIWGILCLVHRCYVFSGDEAIERPCSQIKNVRGGLNVMKT